MEMRMFTQTFSQLSWTDKLLPLLIVLAIVTGTLLSVYAPSTRTAFQGAAVVDVSAPLAVGLIVMMIPPLCKVEWENFHRLICKRSYFPHIILSLLLNWIVCPLLMFGLAWLTLFDLDEYRIGIIMIGMARCIAMVLVWNEIAMGDSSLCAILVLLNSVLQIVLYAPYQIFFCYVITGDYQPAETSIGYSVVAKSVAFFLGIPLAIGLALRLISLFTIGEPRYRTKVLPLVAPWSLIGLIYTIVVIFIEQGNEFIHNIGSAFRCFIPLVAYFTVTWFGAFFLCRLIFSHFLKRSRSAESEPLCGCEEEKMRCDGSSKWAWFCSANYAETITQTFTAASNNFELSLAVAISIYGSESKQAIAATFGPLLEVPILLVLCYVAKYFRIKFLWADVTSDFDD